jgi:acetolactate synthase-1/2/3 large subunit
MEKLKGAEILVRSLEDLGVKYIFGYTGGAILPVFHAIGKSSIKVIINSNEQSSAFSAAGYSRSSNKIGVAIVTSGPAITNTLTAVADAYSDSIPLIVIAGQVSEHKIGTDSFQHIDVESIFKNASKKVISLSNGRDIEVAIKDAYYLAKSGRPGPVVIDFPLDKQQRIHEYNGLDISSFERSYVNEKHLSEDQCEKFFNLILSSKKPLLYIGGGLNSKAGSNSIKKFEDYFGIPLVHTLMAKGVMNERSELNMGMLGMFGVPSANIIIQENDFFFVLGARWDDKIAEKIGFAIDSEIAYVDINPVKMHQIRIERNPKFSYIGEASTTLDDLLEYAKMKNIHLDIKGWQDKAINIKKDCLLDYNKNSEFIQSAEVMDLLSEHIDEKTKIITGVGNHQMLAAQYLLMQKPKSFMTSGSYGTMGFSLPTAVGVYFANPDCKIIAVDGDGSLRMNFGELHTIATLNLSIKIIMINNRSDGMVMNLQDKAYNGLRTGTERQGDVDFSKIAENLGFCYTKRIIDKNRLESELKIFLKKEGSCFLEICTDKEEILYPIVPVGAGYKDMILGPYIKNKFKYLN